MRYFARRYRTICWSMRGYPRSSVPPKGAKYDIPTLVSDLQGLLDHLGVKRAYVGGLSLGGNVAMNFAISHQARTAAVILASTGSDASDRDAFVREYSKLADRTEAEGMRVLVDAFGTAAARQAFRIKDPRGWAEFLAILGEHDSTAAAELIRQAVCRRKTAFELSDELSRLPMPVLVMVGDQDEPVHQPGLHLRRTIPHAAMAMLPFSGHNINLEEPALFNGTAASFLSAVDSGRWGNWTGRRE